MTSVARERALLFTDLVDSVRLTEALGEQRAAALWVEHDRRSRRLLAEHGGFEIDSSDGLFMVFDDALTAARYALAYHGAVRDLGVAARAGLHAGAVALRDNDPREIALGAKPREVHGLAKPFAARLMGLARGGQTLLGAAARVALGDTLPLGASVRRHGHYRLKGLAEPVEVFELGSDESDFLPPADVDKAYRVVQDGDLWRPLREVPHNLAPDRDAFVGRKAELLALAELFEGGARLVTVLGVGGTGKTRLVRRYARAWLGDWPGGVYFCDLSEARGIDGIHFAVALALGVPLGRDDPAVQLGHAIAGRGRCLLILDNFEQLLAHGEATLGLWCDRAADAAFVVTSRERLHLAGETALPVEPLPLRTDAIDLFEARARAHRPGFTVDDGRRAAVLEIVRLLDGLPLAIELAAARMGVLSPAQIVERLADRFKLLAGSRGAARRQATLKAAIDWSWDLLLPWERSALAQCSVFEGGFTLAAAEATIDLADWREAPPALDIVQALVDKSLLRTWRPLERDRFDFEEPYFGMYLSIHEYAADRLRGDERGSRPAESRHGRHFASYGSEALDRSFAADRRVLELDLDNLVAACRRAVARGDPDVAACAFRAAWQVLASRGPLAPAVELAASVLGLAGLDDLRRVQVLLCAAEALARIGRLADAERHIAMALPIARIAASRRWEGRVQLVLGQIVRELGRLDEAQGHMEQALAAARESGDARGEAEALQHVGNLHQQLGQTIESRRCLEASLAIFTRHGDRDGVARVRSGLAVLHRHTGLFEEALREGEASLSMHRAAGNRRGEGIALGNMAAVLDDLGRYDESLANHRAALAIHRQIGSRVIEAVALSNLALQSRRVGDADGARDLLTQALLINREVGNAGSEGMVLANLADLDAEQGRFAAAREAVDEALRLLRQAGIRASIADALAVRGELDLRAGSPQAALDSLRESEQLFRAVDDPLGLAYVICIRGRTLIALGDLEAGRAALHECEAIAGGLALASRTRLDDSIEVLRAACA